MNIIQRIRQFQAATKAEIQLKDVTFIRRYLSKQEQILFYRMSVADQAHSLDVAYKLAKNLKDVEAFQKQPLSNKKEAIIAALMHDVGKVEAPYSLLARSLFVINKSLLKRFNLRNFYRRYGQFKAKSSLLRNFYILEFHPEIGADIFRSINNDDYVYELILKHQEPINNNEHLILNLLKEADQSI